MAIGILKGAYKVGKVAYKLAKKIPAKGWKYGGSAAAGSYIGSSFGKKKERKRILKTVETVISAQQNNRKWFK
tara:strand:- start:1314 stop:1532 length:219 start_codon:yes stop_codon:yes gene_type:complete